MFEALELDTAIVAIKTRDRAELDVLANFAASPKEAGTILAGMDVDLSWFSDEGNRAICLAVDRSSKSGRNMPVEETSIFARSLLRRLELWDDTDERPYVTGARLWGPGPLSAILCLLPFDSDETGRACRRLLRVKTWMDKQNGSCNL